MKYSEVVVGALSIIALVFKPLILTCPSTTAAPTAARPAS
jgi:hypothetical protein